MTDFGLKFVEPDRSKVIVLELVDEVPTPEYCTLGRTKCFSCDRWCWLGDKTLKLVSTGDAMPMCIKCAAVFCPVGHHREEMTGHEFTIDIQAGVILRGRLSRKAD